MARIVAEWIAIENYFKVHHHPFLHSTAPATVNLLNSGLATFQAYAQRGWPTLLAHPHPHPTPITSGRCVRQNAA